MEIKKILNVTQSGKVQLCKHCGGDGKVMDDSWGSGASDKVHCSICRGTGRVKTITAECKVMVPFDYELK